MKICTKCGIEKNESEFNKNKENRGGLRFECRDCQKKYSIKYYEEHKEENKEYGARYYEEHKEEKKEYGARYYEGHKEEKKEYLAKYREEHKEELKEYLANYRGENKEKELLDHAKQRSKKKNLEFRLSIKDVIIPEICPVLRVFQYTEIFTDDIRITVHLLIELIIIKGIQKIILLLFLGE
mgnify:CR=1 FL=1